MYRRLPLALGLAGAVLLFYNTYGLLTEITITTVLGAFISASRNRVARLLGSALMLGTGSFGLYLRLAISSNRPLSHVMLGLALDGSVLILIAGFVVAVPEVARLVFSRKEGIFESGTPGIAKGELSRVPTAKQILLGLSVIGIASETRLVLLGLGSSLQPAWFYSLVGTLLAVAGTVVVQGRGFKREAIGSLLLAVGATILVVSSLGALVPYLRGGLDTIAGSVAGNLLVSGGGLIMAAAAIAVVKVTLQRVRSASN